MVFLDLDPGAPIAAGINPGRDGNSETQRGEGDAQPGADRAWRQEGLREYAGAARGTAITTVPRRASRLWSHRPLTGSCHCVAFVPRAAIAQ